MDSELPDDWDTYFIGTGKIGEGVYGTAYRDMQKVAVKKIRKNPTPGNAIPPALIQEITLLKSLQHPNIVPLQDVIFGEEQLYLVFEFVGMNLKSYINKFPYDKWMEKAELLQAIYYCHQRNILHGDLKPQNLLVGEKGCLKVADFRFDEAINMSDAEKVYTKIYKAPEVLYDCTRLTSAADIWSIGCIAAEMAVKRTLFTVGDSNIDQIFRIFNVLSTPPEPILFRLTNMPDCLEVFPQWKINYLVEILDGYMDVDGIDIVQKMLNYDFATRISAEELLEDPYFADIDRTNLPTGEYQ